MMLKRFLISASLAALTLTAAGVSDTSVAFAEDCYGLGMKLARDKDGQLARATPAIQDGKAVCRIVILLPGRDGARPRRAEYIVPAGDDD